MEDDLRRGREAGFADHVVKPVNLAHLESVLARVTGRTRA
jgi:CheY-like chemotaxis protein